MSRHLSACGIFCVLVVPWGCAPAQPPKANVSDFGVFTSLHLIAAEASVYSEDPNNSNILSNGPFTDAEMRRYFETPTTQPDAGKTRIDSMLDGQQRQSALFQAAQSQFTASLAMTLAKAATQPTSAPAAPAAAVPAIQPDPELENEFKALFTSLLNGSVADSPFDQLDRVADFYAAYVIKKLRVRGDSRAIDPQMMKDLLMTILSERERMNIKSLLDQISQRKNGEPLPAGDRLLLVVFQSHVDPGNKPNVWTGFECGLSQPRRKAIGRVRRMT